MRNAHVTGKFGCLLAIPEDLGSHSISLELVYSPALGARRDTARILSSVLQVVKCLMEFERCDGIGRVRVGQHEAEYATHFGRLVRSNGKLKKVLFFFLPRRKQKFENRFCPRKQ